MYSLEQLQELRSNYPESYYDEACASLAAHSLFIIYRRREALNNRHYKKDERRFLAAHLRHLTDPAYEMTLSEDRQLMDCARNIDPASTEALEEMSMIVRDELNLV